ncbi:DUF4405 domain-containing protein [Lachnospira pectinoschiza]|uniref:Flavinylation-associated cytochrome domain-containing protein n=1 Tax=Lachnospira pectinoschiza TaxID=28052 RepID=A0A1G9TMM4_9FIRM|nr:DUF4405 domain-containing protein [Lachnospira pectinoschiza]SDM48997.1 protein of unknown function [Lachnospira pectinoschiza]
MIIKKHRKGIKIGIDVAMTILLPLLMGYSLIGEALHEWMGMAIFLLFITHHILNWKHRKRKVAFRWSIFFNELVNGLLAVIMILLPVSGMLMSRHLFPWLDLGIPMILIRRTHMLLSYLGFVLMSLHIGMHMETVFAMTGLNKKIAQMGKYRIISILCQIIIVIYGCAAFIKHDFIAYLFLQRYFVYIDYSEPRILFFFDFVVIMMMFAILGYYLIKLLKKQKSV